MWGKKLSMRYSRRMQLHQLTLDNSKNYKYSFNNVQPLCHSAKDLDRAIADAALNLGKRKFSLLQYLDNVKEKDPAHKNAILIYMPQ